MADTTEAKLSWRELVAYHLRRWKAFDLICAVGASLFMGTILERIVDYVRAALARMHGETASAAPTHLAHLLALALVCALVLFKLLPALALVAPVALLARAVGALNTTGKTVTAKQVGFREIGYGALTVAVVAAGYLLGR